MKIPQMDHYLWFVSMECNLKCRYCFVIKKNTKEPGFVDDQVINRTLEFIIKSCKESAHINFFGGEPLLAFPQIQKIIKLGKDKAQSIGKSLRFGIVTNGTLLTHKLINFFESEDVRLIVSCDGDKTTNDEYRIRPNTPDNSSFDFINFSLLKDYPANILRCRMTYTPSTIDRITENVKFLHKMGFINIGCCPMDREDWSVHEQEAILANLMEIIDYWFKCENKFWLSPLMETVKLKISNTNEKRVYHHFHLCWAGRNGVAITTSGNVYPCQRFAFIENWKLGNVGDKSLDLKKFNNLRQVDDKKVGCLALNYKFSEDINTPPDSIFQIKRIYDQAADYYIRKVCEGGGDYSECRGSR
jgi:uncharacterized protein